MLIRNLTPFLFGAKVTSRHPPAPEMTLVVRARYALGADGTLGLPEGPYPLCQGYLTAETYREEDEDRTGECLYPGDFADFKLHAEVMLRGACHTPGGAPLTECPVSFSVGAWSKSLLVVGPRVWTDSLAGAIPAGPAHFTRVPLDWAHAFGGPGHAANPAGKGLGTRELPSIFRPGDTLRTKSDRPLPAGFGPISPAWPQRRRKVGKEYGESYRRKRRAPFYAEDFDWTYFHAAPDDQQLPGYLRGDEEVTFHNLHPDAPVLRTRLPAVRVRAFVNDDAGRFREVGMALDTLFVDLDARELTLTWRGLTEVRERDLHDVETLLFASEPLASEPLPEAHYRALLGDFERDPVNVRAAVPEAHRDLWDRMQEAAKSGARSLADELPAPGLEGLAALLEKRLGPRAQPAVDRLRRVSAEIEKLPAPPGVDVKALVARAVNDALRPRPFAVALAPGAIPTVPVGERLRSALERLAAIRKLAESRGMKLPPRLAELEKVANDPRLRALDPTFRPPGEPEVPEPEPAPCIDASGLDWSGRHLSGADLSNADLTGTLLTGANLRGVKLCGARLARAVLFEADLTGADLSNADLTYANLGGARAEKAVFKRATLDRTHLAGAVLRGAVLAFARGEMPVLDDADLQGADARGIELVRAQLERVRIEGADFSEAHLTECRFADASGRGAHFRRAKLDRSSFSGANLAGASFSGARGERTVWIKAQLEEVDFRHAVLPESHFEEARAERASFVAADLREARFYRSFLDGADFSLAGLFGVDMRYSRLRQVKFEKANLYDAKLQGAAGDGCNFNGANLERAVVGLP